ncbi:hypothetical protein GCM10017673_20530 [Streptosporangium violaceochromogenes]|nr:hypothetical protein GCM10017673_20530 [Streptosporangium violaceochromogenes]
MTGSGTSRRSPPADTGSGNPAATPATVEGATGVCDDCGIMPATPLFRLARSSAFAVVSLGLGVIAHAFAGGAGTAVPVPSAAGGLALAFAAAFAATGRERGVGTILSLLAGTQGALHLLFAATGPAVPSEVARHAHAGLVPGLAMLVAHGWAVGLTALWLARGEALLWGLLRRLGARLGPAVFDEPLPCPARPAVPAGEPAVARSPLLLLRHAVSRRGPPARHLLPAL